MLRPRIREHTVELHNFTLSAYNLMLVRCDTGMTRLLDEK